MIKLMTKILLGLSCSLTLMPNCSYFKPEDPLEKEKKELQELLESSSVSYWKAGKISIRSLPIPSSNLNEAKLFAVQEKRANDLNYGPRLNKIFTYVNLSVLSGRDELPSPQFSAKDYVLLGKEIYQLKKKLKNIDEDEFPTFLEVVTKVQLALKEEPIQFSIPITSSLEHWIFALLMESRATPASWKTYELHKMDLNQLKGTDVKVFALTHLSYDRLRREWNYLADQSLSQALGLLENDSLNFSLPSTSLMLMGSKEKRQEEVFRHQISGSLLLFRAYARSQTEEENLQKLAIKDLEKALEHFTKIGIDNELTWMAASTLYIKKNENQKAIQYLNKLESSPILGPKERHLIAETKEHLKDRDTDGALKALFDKVVFYKIGGNYVYVYLNEIEWAKILERSKAGQNLLLALEDLNERYTQAKKYLDKDALTGKGKKFYDSLTKD